MNNKKIFAGFLTAIIILAALMPTLTSFALDIPEKTDLFYVCDNANILTTETVNEIVAKNDALNDACGAQVVIVTVNGLGGENIENYSNRIFNTWGIGDKEKNNGLLLLISVADQDYWVTQGMGLEEHFSSGTLGVMLDDYLEPDFARGKYDEGVFKFFTAVYLKLANAYNITEPAEGDAPQQTVTGELGGAVSTAMRYIGKFFKVVFIIILVLFIIILGIVLVYTLVPAFRGGTAHRRVNRMPPTGMNRPINRRMNIPPSATRPTVRPPRPTVKPPSSRPSGGGFGGSSSRPRSGGGGISRGGGAGRGRR